MSFLYSIFFGAGAAALAYNTLARRVGYGNKRDVNIFVGAIFVVATIFFYTIAAFILHI